jgi:hypothetical protein
VSWSSKQVSPLAVFVTVLVMIAGVVAITAMLSMRRPPAERRGVLPFPESQLDYYRLDDVAGHLHLPDIRRRVDWPEHPDGGFDLRTNNLGFREDGPTAADKPPNTIRILVTGDSHTDGVVANSESFPNRLEGLLNSSASGGVFEVINGGHGHYSPQNYLGFLKRHLDLQPDHFIVALFVGNDFLDAVAQEWMKGRLEIPERPEEYMQRLEDAQASGTAAVAQGLNQIYLMRTFPTLRARSLEITIDAFESISEVCAEHGIGFFVVLLPAKADVEPETDTTTAGAAEILQLQPGDLELNRRLATALAEALEQRNIPVLDLHADFEASERELFWKRDHHLNITGHRLLAEIFHQRFGSELVPSTPRPPN